MKTLIYLTLFVYSQFCFSQSKVKKKYSLEGNKTVRNINIKVSYVFESPDTKYICFSDESLGKVYIKELGSNAEPKLIYTSNGCGYFPAWTANSSSIIMKSKTQSVKEVKNEAVEYIFKSNKIIKRADIDYRTIQSLTNSKSDFDPVIYINEKLQLVKMDRKSKAVTILEASQMCYQPVLAPDRQKVAVHIGNEIWVYDLNKNEKPKKIGNGLITSWSKDSKFLLGFVDISKDGHEVSNSELYLYDVSGQAVYQLTNTEGVIEMNPAFSGDGSKIYYINSKDGSIIISQLKVN